MLPYPPARAQHRRDFRARQRVLKLFAALGERRGKETIRFVFDGYRFTRKSSCSQSFAAALNAFFFRGTGGCDHGNCAPRCEREWFSNFRHEKGLQKKVYIAEAKHNPIVSAECCRQYNACRAPAKMRNPRLSGAGFSLRGLVLARSKPRRLKPAPLKPHDKSGALAANHGSCLWLRLSRAVLNLFAFAVHLQTELRHLMKMPRPAN